MKLADVINQLASAEFSQLSLGGQGAGEFNDNNYKQLVAHVNLGLTALYRRFNLKEGRLVVSLQQYRTTYPLTSDHAVNSKRSRLPVEERYIQDTAVAPFHDDIHKIEQVFTADGIELALNDKSNPDSVFTSSMTTLIVPKGFVEDAAPEQLTLAYRANHPIIETGMGLFDPNKVMMELPYSHLEALLYFVASRANNPIGMSNEFHAGNSYAAKYEAACQELESVNLRIDTISQEDRFSRKGFV
jgi:hypothetical protein